MVQSCDNILHGFRYTTYKLGPPGEVNTQYLLRKASIEIDEFIAGVLELSESDHDMVVFFVKNTKRLLQKMLHEAESHTDPRKVVCNIPSILANMALIAESVSPEKIPVCFLTSTRNLYNIYVLGIVDMCCTMDGGSTVINQNYNVEPQIYLIDRHIQHYPKLLDWVHKSTEDWEEGELMSFQLRDHPKCRSLECQIWYLTSPDIRCQLHDLKTYHKLGHVTT
jgi:hypothetical protein